MTIFLNLCMLNDVGSWYWERISRLDWPIYIKFLQHTTNEIKTVFDKHFSELFNTNNEIGTYLMSISQSLVPTGTSYVIDSSKYADAFHNFHSLPHMSRSGVRTNFTTTTQLKHSLWYACITQISYNGYPKKSRFKIQVKILTSCILSTFTICLLSLCWVWAPLWPMTCYTYAFITGLCIGSSMMLGCCLKVLLFFMFQLRIRNRSTWECFFWWLHTQKCRTCVTHAGVENKK